MKKTLCFCLLAASAAPLFAGDVAERQVVDEMIRSGSLQPSMVIPVDLGGRTTCFSGTIQSGTTVQLTFTLLEECCDYLFDSCLSDETDTYISNLYGPGGLHLVGQDDPNTCPRDCYAYSPSLLGGPYGYDTNPFGPLPACLPAGDYVLELYSYSSYDPATCQFLNFGPYTVCINCNVGGSVSADEQPAAFALAPNAPNPFNPSTEIRFSLPEAGEAVLRVHDIAGRDVATLVNGVLGRGEHVVSFDGSALSTGVYFYTLEAAGQTTTRKMLLAK